jgi:uncharacterized protein (TIGR00730 family)
MIKINADYIRGFWAIRHLDLPAITILGGWRVKPEQPSGKEAFDLAHSLASHGYSIITGGGPGIMQAANCGAASTCSDPKNIETKTVGISLTMTDLGFINPCARVYKSNYFFIRKEFLFQHSVGFVFFPGGIGTADELFELLNLIIFKLITPQCIILVDKGYWKPLIDWYVFTAMKDDLITLPPHEVFIMVDTAEEALACILGACPVKNT